MTGKCLVISRGRFKVSGSSVAIAQAPIVYRVRKQTSLTVNGQANSVSYGYGNDSRLTQVTQGSTQVGLSYDPAGRRTTLTLPNGAAVTYSYDTASQLRGITYQVGGSTTGTLNYGYDAAH